MDHADQVGRQFGGIAGQVEQLQFDAELEALLVPAGLAHLLYKTMTINRRKFLTITPFIPTLPSLLSYEKILNSVPERTKVLKSERIRLNQTAEYIFNLCDGEKNTFQIADEFRKSFNLPLLTAINDSANTLKYFNNIGIIKFR